MNLKIFYIYIIKQSGLSTEQEVRSWYKNRVYLLHHGLWGKLAVSVSF